ncbi:MAG: GNAT family N-acetyltransferase, partial [Trueperaceae bacterium]
MSRQLAGEGQVTIRRASRRDLDALVELEQGFPGDRMTRAGLSRLLARESAEIWVAEHGQAVVGDAVVLFRHGFDSARLYSMVVAPDFRGRGLAKQLLDAAEAGARERGVVVMRLEVREENAAAIALYERAGYTVRGRTDDYYQDHAAALRLLKRFVSGGATVRGVPYHAQSYSFTSGSASL